MTLDAARKYHHSNQVMSALSLRIANNAWRRVDPGDIDASWSRQLTGFVPVFAALQARSAADADSYIDTALTEQGIEADAEGAVVPAAFAGIASDGRPLETLFNEPSITARQRISDGATTQQGLAAAGKQFRMLVLTQLQDAGRLAGGVAITARPRVGYVRMLNPPSCSRCAVLAGAYYKWNQGFLRHPRCDCRHIPTSENVAGDLKTDPRAYFDSLTDVEQNRIFTNAGAQAIRDGADLGQVVNARRGMSTASVFGRQTRITTEGMTRRGFAGRTLIEQGAQTERVAAETVLRQTRTGVQERTVHRERVRTPRLMPEQIYADATGREDAVRLLKRFGYVT